MVQELHTSDGKYIPVSNVFTNVQDQPTGR